MSFFNASLYYAYTHYRFCFNGETAMNGDAAVATLNTITFQATNNLQLTAIQRFYSYRYHSLQCFVQRLRTHTKRKRSVRCHSVASNCKTHPDGIHRLCLSPLATLWRVGSVTFVGQHAANQFPAESQMDNLSTLPTAFTPKRLQRKRQGEDSISRQK